MAAAQECELLDLEGEWRALDALAVVDIARVDTAHGLPRAICTLWCKCEHEKKAEKQPQVACNKKTITTVEQAVRNLRLKIETEHAGCIAAAEVARAAAAGPMTREPSDALGVLMASRQKQISADGAEAALDAAETRRDAARQELFHPRAVSLSPV